VKRFADAFRRRQRFNVLVFALTVLVAVAALEIADLWWRRERALKTAERRSSNLSIVLAEYVRGSFASADAALRQLQVHGRRIGGPAASKDEWESILGPGQAGLSEVGSLSVTNAEGIITHSTIPAIVGQSRADNYLFRQLAGAGQDMLIVVVPTSRARQRSSTSFPSGAG